MKLIVLNEEYEFLKASVNEEILDNLINLTFNIEESEKYYVEKINIYGNNVTREEVIRNNLIVDHSRDLRKTKKKYIGKKLLNFAFGGAVESYPQLNEKFEISDVLFTLDYKSKLGTIIKKEVCTC